MTPPELAYSSSPRDLYQNSAAPSVRTVRFTFWALGFVLAAAQVWVFRYQATTDSISYLDMSDGVLPGSDWHRMINGVWSPLYPLLLGIVRRVLPIPARIEIVAAHWMNLGFFLFAFLCFEFLLGGLLPTLEVGENARIAPPRFPRKTYLVIAYSLFLWASIAEISVRNLRPDMLLSGFVYLAAGVLIRMHGRRARWKDYLVLGSVLGVGVLAKEAMLPLGLLIILASLLAVKSWRPALKMALTALALQISIGSLYFVPLSHARGFLTLGQSGAFNYIVHVNNARPEVYLQTPGSARGSFSHPPEKIFSSPPAYAFSSAAQVTYPMRFDPSDWIAGVRPRVVLKRQAGVVLRNILNIARLLLQIWPVIVAVSLLAYFSPTGVPHSFQKTWPVWLIGLAGCAMYVPVYVEPRYVAAFIILFWLGIIFGFQAPLNFNRKLVVAGSVAIAASLLLPLASSTYSTYFQVGRSLNNHADAAAALSGVGIHPGDHVARISPFPYDVAVERIARVQVSAEVDFEHAKEFWGSSPGTQKELLQTLASHDARAVIATSPQFTPDTQAEWTRLGSTQYWVWLPPGSFTHGSATNANPSVQN
jgi:hypothetical protein